MRRLIVLGVAAALAILTAAPVLAQTAPVMPTVSVAAGPSVDQWLLQPCSDVLRIYQRPLSFVLSRTAPLANPLTVWYATSGTAQPGVHFEALPGAATFAPGQDTAVVAVVPLSGPQAQLVNLTLQIQSASGPVSFGATEATIEFVSPWDERPVECGYRFTDDSWNHTQTVPLGEPVHALTLEQVVPPAVLPATGVFRVVSGFLPLGVQLQPDGTFTGRTLVPGTSVSTIEACRPTPPGTCVRTELTITVVVPAVPQVPFCPWPGFSFLPAPLRSWVTQMLPSLAFCS